MHNQLSGGCCSTACIRLAKEGDKSSIECIVEGFGPLIHSLSSRFRLPYGLLSKEDLVQAGALGLMKAIDKYSFQTEASFKTYAMYWILGEMRMALRKAVDSTGIYPIKRRIESEREKLCAKLQRMPTIDELSNACGLSQACIAEILAMSDIMHEQTEEGINSIYDLITSTEQDVTSTADLRIALESLTLEERKIIMLRYFRDLTQKKTALMIGKSQTQVSRIENRALNRLRAQLI